MTRLQALAPLSIMFVLVACASQKDDGKTPSAPPPAPASAAPANPAPAPSVTAPAPAPAPAPPRVPTTAVAEGAVCPPEMRKVTDVPIAIDRATLSFTRARGGGCPTRPTYTAFYTKANPMPVIVCEDVGADMCEMAIMAEPISIDLSAALQSAGATSAVLAR